MSKTKKEELKESKCNCSEECTCGDDCNCTEENKCNDNCTCYEEQCNCDDKCECEEECCCKDDCNCDECNCNDEMIEELNDEIKSLKEALLRNQAELQNYKRRKEEENAKLQKYKNEDLIKELLNIVDNFERAIKMDDDDLSDDVSKFLEGFKLIYGNTVNILSKFDVKVIEAEGIEFDPNYHHAVLTDHNENKPEGVVLEVLQKGYIYKDRVIRPAMVKVNE